MHKLVLQRFIEGLFRDVNLLEPRLCNIRAPGTDQPLLDFG